MPRSEYGLASFTIYDGVGQVGWGVLSLLTWNFGFFGGSWGGGENRWVEFPHPRHYKIFMLITFSISQGFCSINIIY